MKVGFIGLGQMGHAMAANLLQAGHELTVWNRSADKAGDLVAAGARVVASPAEAAEGDVVMTMLADDAAVEAVVYGDDGILGAPALHVSHSTIGVPLVERLTRDHAARSGFVAAPVFGRPPPRRRASCSWWPPERTKRSSAARPCSRPSANAPSGSGRRPRPRAW